MRLCIGWSFRRRIERLQHGTLVIQMCRLVWQRRIRDAVLAGAVELLGFAANQAPDPPSLAPLRFHPGIPPVRHMFLNGFTI